MLEHKDVDWIQDLIHKPYLFELVCMGSCIAKSDGQSEPDIPEHKEGYRYAAYAERIKPLDLALFKGGDSVSGLIQFLEKRKLNKTSSAGYDVGPGAFSHVGIIVTSEILDDDRLDPNKLYVWESTMSGSLSDGVCNIEDESFLGVQLRDFDKVLVAYDEDPDSRIAIAHLGDTTFNRGSTRLRKRFTNLFTKYDGTRYDANFLSLGSSICPCLRPAREAVENALNTEDWLFCSELVATIYKELGLFDKSVNPKNVVPTDFLGYDADSKESGGIPVIVEEPVYVVSERWWDGISVPESLETSESDKGSESSILSLTSASSPLVKGKKGKKKGRK